MFKKKKIIFLQSHPIQYFSPLFQLLAKEEAIDLMVLYCSDYGTKGKRFHPELGELDQWDTPLLEGYNYKFLKNNSWKPSIFNGFFGLINLDIFKLLKNERGSFLIIHGWNYFTHVFAIIIGRILELKICIRGDNPYNQEILKNKKLIFLKKVLLGKILFKFIHYFLYVGNQNKEFYKYYGVPESKLVFAPHAVDNDRFQTEYEKYKDKKWVLRKELGLPADKKIILFSGKYIPKKQPMDLLTAYYSLNNENTALVFLGDGELRKDMEDYINHNNLKDVYLTGFKNQSEVGKYFAAADIFVLPSGAGETWGLVVNEAMNFSLPIIVSDMVGCSDDLVRENENGFKFKVSDIEDLKSKLNILIKDIDLRKRFGAKSLELVNNYSYSKTIKNIKSI